VDQNAMAEAVETTLQHKTGVQQVMVPLTEFKPQTSKETSLWNAWQQSIIENNYLKGKVNDLQAKINLLIQKENQQKTEKETYHTDEDIKNETGWVMQEERRKRRKK
jgi:hypothetical protein